MIVFSKEPAKIKHALKHLLMSDGLTCAWCHRDFGPLEWDGGECLYEITYSSNHSDVQTQDPDEDIEYISCKDI